MFGEYILTVLIYCGLGILFGFFPGYFALVYYVARAHMVHHKPVPKWILYLSGRDQQTRQYSFSLRRSLGSHVLVWAIFIPWVVMCVVFTPTLASLNAGGDMVKTLIIDIIYPVSILATWILPSVLLERYLKQLNPMDDMEMQLDRQEP
jgi:hypothetical protein